MTPDFDTRLKSIISAMENIVIPSIASDDSMSLQQAGLIVRHIAIMRQQLPYLQVFESLCLHDMEQLARQILVSPSIGSLRGTPADLQAALSTDNLTAQERYIAIGRAVEEVINAAQSMPEALLLEEVAGPVLEFSERQTMRERVWFAGTGFDPHAESLPSISSLFRSG